MTRFGPVGRSVGGKVTQVAVGATRVAVPPVPLIQPLHEAGARSRGAPMPASPVRRLAPVLAATAALDLVVPCTASAVTSAPAPARAVTASLGAGDARGRRPAGRAGPLRLHPTDLVRGGRIQGAQRATVGDGDRSRGRRPTPGGQLRGMAGAAGGRSATGGVVPPGRRRHALDLAGLGADAGRQRRSRRGAAPGAASPPTPRCRDCPTSSAASVTAASSSAPPAPRTAG